MGLGVMRRLIVLVDYELVLIWIGTVVGVVDLSVYIRLRGDYTLRNNVVGTRRQWSGIGGMNCGSGE